MGVESPKFSSPFHLLLFFIPFYVIEICKLLINRKSGWYNQNAMAVEVRVTFEFTVYFLK
jgi:hypothetical protein